ncbi:MAG TPA: VCBS repeat-containing protein [Verrucomicrobiae bacterium]
MSYRALHRWLPDRAKGVAGVALLLGLVLLEKSPLHAGELASFPAGTGGWNMGTLAVGNVTGNSTPEIIVPYRTTGGLWHLDAFQPNGTRLSGFPYGGTTQEINVSPTLYDLDGDGLEEIIFTQGHNVIALRGNGTVLWSTTVNYSNYVPDSGFMAVTNGFYWSNGGGFISRLPSTAVFSSQVSSPIVADINGDGVKEVVTAWKIDPDSASNHQDFNPFINDIWGSGEWGTMGEVWSGGVMFFNAQTGQKNYTYHLHQLVESGLALGRGDAGASLKTYVLNDSDSVAAFDATKPHGLHGNGNLHKQFGKNQRLITGSYQLGADIYAVDIDGDGLDEVLVGSTQSNPLWQPNETILDDDGTVMWRKWKPAVTIPVTQWQNNSCMIPVNPDHDNRIDVLSFTHAHEIAFRSWNGVELVDRSGWPKNFYPQLPTPPVVGDVDGDGAEEIVIGTYDPANASVNGTLYVFALDGSVKNSVSVAGGLKHIPTLADVTGDGGVEVIYRSLAGRVYIQNFGANRTGLVSWATHRSNQKRDGNLGVSLYPAGTPVITQKDGGYRRASFSWSITGSALAWRIYRAENPDGPFTPIITLTGDKRAHTDYLLKAGSQYVYEVEAVYADRSVRSAPFAVLSQMNGNLLTNGGFEENSESHWDKWFTGELSWTNMMTTASGVYGGRSAMQVNLTNHTSNGTISQYGQYGTPDGNMPVVSGQLYSMGGFFKSKGLSQPSEHWLEWSSTVTAENTNARPARPWPLYFTPHFTIGTNATEWTYANRAFVMPAGFPNAEVGARYTVNGATSGSFMMDDVFFRAMPSPNDANWTELLPLGATWKYSVMTPASDWYARGFNDSAWSSGKAKLGTGGGPRNIVTSITPQKDAYYFRRSFNVPTEMFEEFLLSATCTRGANGKALEIYLNGVKLVTSGIDTVSDQGNDVLYYDLTPFIGLLQPGENVIAVMLNNVWSSWDDVAFDLRLQAMSYAPTTASFDNIIWKTGLIDQLLGVELEMIVPPKSVWRLESSDSLSSPNWQLMEVINDRPEGSFTVRDIGQGGRVPPLLAPRRFYRLSPY